MSGMGRTTPTANTFTAMTPPALCQTHPEAAAELGLWAIFRACEANRARIEAAQRVREAGRRIREAELAAKGRFWWQDADLRDKVEEQTTDTIP